jgi:hypothetical protein
MFSILSTSSDRELCFVERSGDDLLVEIRGQSPVASITVSTYTDNLGLYWFFERLGELSSPWSGEMAWASLEGEFELKASCSATGSVMFHVRVYGSAGSPEEWRLMAGITSEFGQLSTIAKQARSFFFAEHA